MIEVIIYILIGAFVGWNLPQPSWAKNIQDRIVGLVKKG